MGTEDRVVARYILRLYVAGHTPNSIKAIGNLRRLTDRYLPGEFQIEIIDLLRDPLRAADDDIIATPTLVKKFPAPESRIIGNLADMARTLSALGIDVME